MSLVMMKSSTSPLLNTIYSSLNYLHYDLWQEIGDPRVKEYPFFSGGPWSVASIVMVYLYFVLHLGPQYMKDRKPYDLKGFVLLYNIAMVVFNGWMFVAGMLLTRGGIDAWGCQVSSHSLYHNFRLMRHFLLMTVHSQLVDKTARDPVEMSKLFIGHLFFTSKIIELLDTVIFVLRKKKSQITPLHVIHHSLVPILIWIGYKISPGGNMAMFPLINAAIHTIMYGYYGLSTLGESVRPYLWWKKYLTKIQMIQFVVVMIHSFHVLFIPGCNFPKGLLYMSIVNGLLFLVLFYSFYKSAYRRAPAKDSVKRPASPVLTMDNNNIDKNNKTSSLKFNSTKLE